MPNWHPKKGAARADRHSALHCSGSHCRSPCGTPGNRRGAGLCPHAGFALTWQKVPYEFIMHLALGTSMASIIFTSVSSFWAHHKRGAVRWIIVQRIVPGILLGTFLGTCVAARLSTNFLKGFFVIFLYYVAAQMLTDRKPKPSREIPGNLGMFGVGNVIGAVSTGGHRRRHPLGAFHDVVQRACARGHRNFRSHRVSHRPRGDCGVHLTACSLPACRAILPIPWDMSICRPWQASLSPASSRRPSVSGWRTACRFQAQTRLCHTAPDRGDTHAHQPGMKNSPALERGSAG